MSAFTLYRYTHPDGSSKDWAVRRNDDGTLTTRWGPTGPVLPQTSTRRGDLIRLEREKERKGYQWVGPVEIDDDGRVRPMGSDPRAGTAPPSPAEPPDEAVYWRLNRTVSAAPADLLAWSRAVAAMVDRLAEMAGCERTPGSDFAPGGLQGWTLPATGDSGAGQLRPDQGPLPLLVLLAMKATAPAGVSLTLATEDSREIGTDLRAESAVLAGFGADLETVRPWAEVLGLLPARLNLATAIHSEGDAWF
jgi:hypothetical protein